MIHRGARPAIAANPAFPWPTFETNDDVDDDDEVSISLNLFNRRRNKISWSVFPWQVV